MAFHPCYKLHRVFLPRPDHEFGRLRIPTLEAVAKYPIVTYDQLFGARSEILRAFESRRLQPNIVLSATDADIRHRRARGL